MGGGAVHWLMRGGWRLEGYAHRVDDYIVIFAGSGVTSPASITLSASIG